jgi:Protein of unknown function (DUF998)
MHAIRMTAALGVTLCATGVLMIAALHVIPTAFEIDPVRRTISEYALHETAWLFNWGVLALVAGSAAVLIAAAAGGLVRPRSVGGAGLVLWIVGLTGVVTFPKHNWMIGPSAWGDVHRVASLVAFLSLPVAVIAIARTTADHRARRASIAGAVLALAFFGIIAGAVLLEPFTGVRWWRAIPLGTVERGLAAAEVATIIALGVWAGTPKGGARPESAAKSVQTGAATLDS